MQRLWGAWRPAAVALQGWQAARARRGGCPYPLHTPWLPVASPPARPSLLQEERIIFITTVLSRPESLPPVARPGAGGAGHAAAGGAAGVSADGGSELADVHLGFWCAPVPAAMQRHASAGVRFPASTHPLPPPARCPRRTRRRNPKRFNVAVTRAKALLVVVGQPAVLLEDASWRELLLHCFSQGAYRGAGADAIRQRFRLEPGAAAALPDLPPGAGAAGAAGGADEAGDEELQRAIGQLAELALLGAGRADEMFPQTLEVRGRGATKCGWVGGRLGSGGRDPYSPCCLLLSPCCLPGNVCGVAGRGAV